ncbi:MAG: hypothetical protein QXQ69_03335 [Candidatus Aenigmatarchaeota archaeon]
MEESKNFVKDFVSKFVKARPNRISLKLDWEKDLSVISIYISELKLESEQPKTIDFTSFAKGVIEAYEETYGKLEVVPISFREEIYRNEKVSLDLYPTGSLGVFDIFIKYNEKPTRNGDEYGINL